MTLVHPKRIYIETYHGCNARCAICPTDEWERPPGPMDQDVFERILAETVQFKDNLIVVSLYSVGEPLMDKKIDLRVAQCKEAGLPNVGFSTNGFFLDEAWSTRLLQARAFPSTPWTRRLTRRSEGA